MGRAVPRVRFVSWIQKKTTGRKHFIIFGWGDLFVSYLCAWLSWTLLLFHGPYFVGAFRECVVVFPVGTANVLSLLFFWGGGGSLLVGGQQRCCYLPPC